jgi:hypothetical protein
MGVGGKISVALCTFNGQKFLREQLESILGQSRPPDELIIQDDGSTDATITVIEQFARRSDIPVKLLMNSQRIGSTRNFEEAIRRCSGDIIFLADQDDIWLKDKVQKFEAVFIEQPGTGLLFSDAELIDENSERIKGSLWEATFPRAKKRRFASGEAMSVLVWGDTVTGAAMAFRSNLREHFIPTPDVRVYSHDGWIALTTAMVSSVGFLPTPLLQYRVHAGQQIGIGAHRGVGQAPRTRRERFEEALRLLETMRQEFSRLAMSLVEQSDRRQIEATLGELEDRRRHLECRLALQMSWPKSVAPLLREVANRRYFKYSNGVRSILSDLLRCR